MDDRREQFMQGQGDNNGFPWRATPDPENVESTNMANNYPYPTYPPPWPGYTNQEGCQPGAGDWHSGSMDTSAGDSHLPFKKRGMADSGGEQEYTDASHYGYRGYDEGIPGSRWEHMPAQVTQSYDPRSTHYSEVEGELVPPRPQGQEYNELLEEGNVHGQKYTESIERGKISEFTEGDQDAEEDSVCMRPNSNMKTGQTNSEEIRREIPTEVTTPNREDETLEDENIRHVEKSGYVAHEDRNRQSTVMDELHHTTQEQCENEEHISGSLHWKPLSPSTNSQEEETETQDEDTTEKPADFDDSPDDKSPELEDMVHEVSSSETETTDREENQRHNDVGGINETQAYYQSDHDEIKDSSAHLEEALISETSPEESVELPQSPKEATDPEVPVVGASDSSALHEQVMDLERKDSLPYSEVKDGRLAEETKGSLVSQKEGIDSEEHCGGAENTRVPLEKGIDASQEDEHQKDVSSVDDLQADGADCSSLQESSKLQEVEDGIDQENTSDSHVPTEEVQGSEVPNKLAVDFDVSQEEMADLSGSTEKVQDPGIDPTVPQDESENHEAMCVEESNEGAMHYEGPQEVEEDKGGDEQPRNLEEEEPKHEEEIVPAEQLSHVKETTVMNSDEVEDSAVDDAEAESKPACMGQETDTPNRNVAEDTVGAVLQDILTEVCGARLDIEDHDAKTEPKSSPEMEDETTCSEDEKMEVDSECQDTVIHDEEDMDNSLSFIKIDETVGSAIEFYSDDSDVEVVSTEEVDTKGMLEAVEAIVEELVTRALDESPSDTAHELLEYLLDRTIAESPSEISRSILSDVLDRVYEESPTEICSSIMEGVIDAVIAQSPEAICESIMAELIDRAVPEKKVPKTTERAPRRSSARVKPAPDLRLVGWTSPQPLAVEVKSLCTVQRLGELGFEGIKNLLTQSLRTQQAANKGQHACLQYIASSKGLMLKKDILETRNRVPMTLTPDGRHMCRVCGSKWQKQWPCVAHLMKQHKWVPDMVYLCRPCGYAAQHADKFVQHMAGKGHCQRTGLKLTAQEQALEGTSQELVIEIQDPDTVSMELVKKHGLKQAVVRLEALTPKQLIASYNRKRKASPGKAKSKANLSKTPTKKQKVSSKDQSKPTVSAKKTASGMLSKGSAQKGNIKAKGFGPKSEAKTKTSPAKSVTKAKSSMTKARQTAAKKSTVVKSSKVVGKKSTVAKTLKIALKMALSSSSKAVPTKINIKGTKGTISKAGSKGAATKVTPKSAVSIKGSKSGGQRIIGSVVINQKPKPATKATAKAQNSGESKSKGKATKRSLSPAAAQNSPVRTKATRLSTSSPIPAPPSPCKVVLSRVSPKNVNQPGKAAGNKSSKMPSSPHPSLKSPRSRSEKSSWSISEEIRQEEMAASYIRLPSAPGDLYECVLCDICTRNDTSWQNHLTTSWHLEKVAEFEKQNPPRRQTRSQPDDLTVIEELPPTKRITPKSRSSGVVSTAKSVMARSSDQRAPKHTFGASKTLLCTICGIGFQTKAQRQKHFGSKMHREKVTEKVAQTNREAQRPSPGGSQALVCTHCSRKFPNKTFLRKHQRTQHKGTPSNQYAEVEASKAPVGQQMKQQGGTEKQGIFKCTDCNKTYSHSCSLDRHLKSPEHKRTKAREQKDVKVTSSKADKASSDFNCRKCDIQFDTKCDLQRHYQTQGHKMYDRRRPLGNKEKEYILYKPGGFIRCELCSVETKKVKAWDFHLATARHKNNVTQYLATASDQASTSGNSESRKDSPMGSKRKANNSEEAEPRSKRRSAEEAGNRIKDLSYLNTMSTQSMIHMMKQQEKAEKDGSTNKTQQLQKTPTGTQSSSSSRQAEAAATSSTLPPYRSKRGHIPRQTDCILIDDDDDSGSTPTSLEMVPSNQAFIQQPGSSSGQVLDGLVGLCVDFVKSKPSQAGPKAKKSKANTVRSPVVALSRQDVTPPQRPPKEKQSQQQTQDDDGPYPVAMSAGIWAPVSPMDAPAVLPSSRSLLAQPTAPTPGPVATSPVMQQPRASAPVPEEYVECVSPGVLVPFPRLVPKLNGNRVFACNICGDEFKLQKEYNQHYSEEHAEKINVFYCKTCTFISISSRKMSAHLVDFHRTCAPVSHHCQPVNPYVALDVCILCGNSRHPSLLHRCSVAGPN